MPLLRGSRNTKCNILNLCERADWGVVRSCSNHQIFHLHVSRGPARIGAFFSDLRLLLLLYSSLCAHRIRDNFVTWNIVGQAVFCVAGAMFFALLV